MRSVLRKLLIALAVLAGLLSLAGVYAMRADQRRLAAATNPCEHACLLDSGGVDSCRRECASHPLTYGPAALPSSR